MKQLFQISWFSRVWTVQEVIKSSQNPIVLHRQQSFPWHILVWAVSWLRQNGYIRLEEIPDEIYNVDTIDLLKKSRVNWSLDVLLFITQIKYNTSDQRNKVYTLLDLVAETEETTTMPEALIPDYTVDIKHTYLKIAKYLLL